MKKYLVLTFIAILVLAVSGCLFQPAPTPAPTKATLTGQVIVPQGAVRQVGGQALPGATVNVIDPVTGNIVATTTTDANGNYQVEVPPGGPYIIEAVKGNLKILDISPQVEVGQTYDLGTADATSTAVALVFQEKVTAGEDPTQINLDEILEDPKIGNLIQAVEEALEAGEDPTTAPEVEEIVEVIVAPPSAPSTPTTPSTPVAQIELMGNGKPYPCNGCWSSWTDSEGTEHKHSRFKGLNEIAFDGQCVRIYPKSGERLPQNIKVQLTGQRWKPDLGDYINYSALGLERGNNSWDNEVKTIIEGHLTQGGSLSQNGYRMVYQGNELRIHLADNYSDAFKAVPWKRVTLKIFNETGAEVGRYVFKKAEIGLGNCAITDNGGIFPRVEAAFGQCVWWALWRKWEEEWKPDNSKMIQNPNFYPPTGGKLIEAQKWQPQRFDIIVLYKAPDDGHYAFVEKVEDYWRSDGVFYKKLTISQFNLKKINDCTEVYSEDVIYWRPDREKVAFTKNTEGAPIYYMDVDPIDPNTSTWKWYYVGSERPTATIPPAPTISPTPQPTPTTPPTPTPTILPTPFPSAPPPTPTPTPIISDRVEIIGGWTETDTNLSSKSPALSRSDEYRTPNASNKKRIIRNSNFKNSRSSRQVDGWTVQYFVGVDWEAYPGASGYRIYKSINGEPFTLAYDWQLGDDSDTYGYGEDYSISFGSTYSYYVVAYGPDWETTPSETITISPRFLPPIFLESPPNGSTVSDSSFTLKWQIGSMDPSIPKATDPSMTWVYIYKSDFEPFPDDLADLSFNFATSDFIQEVICNEELESGYEYKWSVQIQSESSLEEHLRITSFADTWTFTYQ